MSNSTYNLLDYIRSIVDKSPIELDKGYSQFALNQYFSKWKNCVHYINAIGQYRLKDNVHYKYLMTVIPRGWQRKVEFPKKVEKKQKDIQNIMEYYNVKDSIAEEYLIVMSEEELKYLREYYDV